MFTCEDIHNSRRISSVYLEGAKFRPRLFTRQMDESGLVAVTTESCLRIPRSEGPAVEPAQNYEGDHQASNNAPEDRRGNQPKVGGLNDLPGLIRPAQRQRETAKQSEPRLAVLTAV